MVGISSGIHGFRKALKTPTDYGTLPDSAIAIAFVSAAVTIISGGILTSFVEPMITVWITPRLYLIEQLTNMVK